MNTCVIDGCMNPVCRSARRRGYCVKHYSRWKRHGDANFVATHKGPPKKNRLCEVEGCSNKHYCKGMCIKHYAAMQNNGTLEKKRRPLKTYIRGYVVLYKPDHPNAAKNGYVYEHTAVIAESIGRPLAAGEAVHHKNGIKDDNQLSNLELWNRVHPRGARVSDLVAWAKEIIGNYEGGNHGGGVFTSHFIHGSP